MRILGIDPGVATTGHGIIDIDGQRLKLIQYGCITTEANHLFEKRLKKIYQELSKLIKTLQPEIVTIEKIFFAKNVKTALNICHSRGIVLLCAANYKIEIKEYSPLQVKQAVTGYGKATKEQVQQMVKRLLNLEKLPEPDDAADALAIAICCAHSLKIERMKLL